MAIVAYGYGLEAPSGGPSFLVDDIIIALVAEPDITVDDDLVITAPTDDIDISVNPDIDIEVE